MMPALRSVLVVRVAAIGDVVMASALVSRLRAEHPTARITWLCGVGVAPLVAAFGVDEVVTVDERALLRGGRLGALGALLPVWKRLVGRRFDLVLVAHTDRRYDVLVAGARAGTRRALRGSWGPVRGRAFVDAYAALLDEGARRGPTRRSWDVVDLREAALPTVSSSAQVLLVPGGARNVLREAPHRRWPVDSYVELARRLRQQGLGVALLGGPGDEWVRLAFAGLDVEDRIGRYSLLETVSAMRSAELVISHDTGPMHLARLVRAPMIALFGPTMPSEFVPSGAREVAVEWGGADLACRPCYDGREFAACARHLCVEEIAVDRVEALALQRLAPEART